MRNWEKALEKHVREWMDYQLGITERRPETIVPQETLTIQRFRESLERRGGELLKMDVSVQPYRIQRLDLEELVRYQLYFTKLIKVKDHYHLEEHIHKREAKTHAGRIIIDKRLQDSSLQAARHSPPTDIKGERSFVYDRRKAVQYAERWWNDYNPQYRAFSVNCTNFVSQCLRAGNAPMRGMPNREKGWWYTDDGWSYSWSVAHSFRWYLSSSTSGLTAVEVEEAADLGLGDVICYDFNGDNRWQHTTIVTNFDGNNEPLVNAQTSNSRARYWKYDDSTAWTPNIKYKFFRIQ
ncbi:amidase domain-containing protein [Bacillus piscicola]|uniref:amidase domain-containing protein n=1 Tax=Bacillus piscicola TaxID=1632684 RepID=UPI001F0945CD|nr:amidase domain-containing protein [Bacillus piscicola]